MTGIEWVLNPDGTRGITVNSKTGCLNHTPEGLCLGGLFPCYAYKLSHGGLKQRYLASSNLAKSYRIARGVLNENATDPYNDPFYPRFWPERLDKIRAIKKPTGIFLDDMSDWMGDYWPEEWARQELQVMRNCPQHRFYTLTKQPQNLIKFSPFPENCWVGVTATNQEMMADALRELHKIEAKVKYLSFEPLLDRITFASWRNQPVWFNDLDWLIIGACTGSMSDIQTAMHFHPELKPKFWGNKSTLQPKIEWVKEIVEAADKAGIKVFLKDNLRPLFRYPENPWAWPKVGGLLRQEMPNEL